LNDNSDAGKKFTIAVDYYEEGKYYKALRLFEDLKSRFRGTPKDEQLNYYIAHCYYQERDYVLGSHYFNKFAKDFPQSENAEEAKYMSAYCYYMDSPRTSLDQNTTMEAIKEFQVFIELYPNSERISECNVLLDKLREKLEGKDYDNAYLFYKIGDYQASVIALQNVLEDYPETLKKEEILFTILKARYTYAAKSIENKQQERFELTRTAYENLVKEFPETQYLKEASAIYQKAISHLEIN
jgi:outer membrane protein assembly factor BamD